MEGFDIIKHKLVKFRSLNRAMRPWLAFQ